MYKTEFDTAWKRVDMKSIKDKIHTIVKTLQEIKSD